MVSAYNCVCLCYIFLCVCKFILGEAKALFWGVPALIKAGNWPDNGKENRSFLDGCGLGLCQGSDKTANYSFSGICP